jgi:chromosome segregation ATPase
LQSAEDQLEEEAERLRTDLVGVRTELEFAQAEIGRYKAQAAEMELQLVSARNQASTAREARATAHQDAQKWLKRGEASQEAAKRLKDELAKLKADAEEKAELAQKASVAREAKGLALLEAEKGKVQTLQTELESAKKALEEHIADMAPRPQSAAATEASSGVGAPPAPGRMDLSAGIQHVARFEANIVALETAHATTTSAWIAERQRLEDERNEMTASKTELQGQLRTAAESIRALRQKCDTSKQEINDARGNEAIYRDLCRKLEGDLRSAKAASMVNAAAPMPAVRITSEATGSSAAVGQLGRHVSGSAQLVAQLPQQGVSGELLPLRTRDLTRGWTNRFRSNIY